MCKQPLEHLVRNRGEGSDPGLEDVALQQRQRIAHDDCVAIEHQEIRLVSIPQFGEQLETVGRAVADLQPRDDADLGAEALEGARLDTSSDLFGQDGLIDFYGNSRPDGDGEKPLSTGHADPGTNGTITVSIAADFRGQWINATWTRVTGLDYYPESVTSELSNAILVGQ